jgi:hypothetical protein
MSPSLTTFSSFGIVSLRALPVQIATFATPADVGTLLEFPSGGEARDIPVPIPFLPGMDEVEVTTAAAAIGSRAVERPSEHAGPSGSGTSSTLTFSPPVAGAPVTLGRIEIEGFTLTAASGIRRRLQPTSGAAVFWNSASGQASSGATGVEPEHAVHILVSPDNGPPFLAAPVYPMPGDGSALYGEALGGAALTCVLDASAGTARLVLTPQTGAATPARLVLTVVRNAPDKPNLPNEATPISWRAIRVTAIWRVQPANLKVEAVAGSKTVTVAQTPGAQGRDFIDFDFAAAARSLCEPAYAAAAGQTDLGLSLRVTAIGPGAARLRLSQAGVRYLQRSLSQSVKLGLRGAPAIVELRGADSGLHPVALDLSVQGKLLPSRLTDGSDEQPPDPRRGLVAKEAIRLARRTALTPVERALPLVRVALFGRAAGASEILATLHQGDQMRVGVPLGPPVALTLESNPAASWHRIALTPAILPPLPEVIWVVLQATRGQFFWHGNPADDDTALMSGDGGSSWADAATRPALQLSVHETTITPTVLPLRWRAADRSGLLAPDITHGSRPDFAQHLLVAEDTQAAPLAALALAPLTLAFTCRRDVDLSVTDATFAYNPWTARQ